MQNENFVTTPVVSAPVTSRQIHWRAYSAVGLALLTFTMGPSWIRLAQNEGVDSMFLVAFRMTAATLILTPMVLHRYIPELRQLTRQDWVLVLIAGLLTAAHFLLGFVGLLYNSVLMNEVLGSSSVLWVAILEIFILKVHHGRTVWFGLTLALIGAILIALGGSTDSAVGRNPTLGTVIALSGAVAYAFYLIVGSKLRAKISIIPFLWLIFGLAAITTNIGLLVTHTPVLGYSTNGYLWAIIMTIMLQLVAHGSYNYALGHISPTYLTVFAQLAVVGSAVAAYFFFAEIPHPLQLAGGIAIIGGVIIVSLTQTRRSTAE